MADKFGMMSEAYFKGKRELLAWASDFLSTDIAKVEHFATGAHYCQLVDALFGGIKMSKVNFSARTEPEYIKNWKLIQAVFKKHDIQKVIPIERLIKARFQDNLEFLQWFHQFFASTWSGEPYDAEARRKRSKTAPNTRNVRRKPSAAPPISSGKENFGRAAQQRSGGGAPSEALRAENKTLRSQVESMSESQEKLRNKLRTLDNEHKDLSRVAKDIEKERDFYFNKVLQVEEVCKASADANQEYVQKILKILYADASPRSDAAEPEAAESADMGED